MLEPHKPQTDECSPEELAAIEEELRILQTVLTSLDKQIINHSARLSVESKRARELTSELVATRRDEDRAMLASEEAVSHALRDKQTLDVKILSQLLKKPYFARIVVQEGSENLEYRLGFAANPECRIVDWRKAPVSKLYYEYKLGEEYFEVIQGREREGRVILRNGLEIEDGKLLRVSNIHGVFVFDNNRWCKHALTGAGSLSRAGRISSSEKTGGYLPNIAALITAEQFQAITEDAETAILIQGIAGSGKTTVALHRLAWLLHESNSDYRPQNCIVVMVSNTMRSYCSRLLPSLGTTEVPTTTYRDWITEKIKPLAPELVCPDRSLRVALQPPLGVARLKTALGFLAALEDLALEQAGTPLQSARQYYLHLLELLYSQPQLITENDDTGLIDKELILAGQAHDRANQEQNVLNECDLPLLLRAHQIRSRVHNSAAAPVTYYDHIVVDEVQDLSSPELATLIASTHKTRNLTLVGDTAQEASSSSAFPGWDRLRKHWQFEDESSRYISLEVSHRSTLPIMRFADHIQQEQRTKSGRAGRVPIWFKCNSESKGVQSVITWLQTAIERYPHDITAVICRTAAEARQALSLLQPTFGPVVRLGSESDFEFDAGIVVTDVQRTRGLEFLNVLIWNPTTADYPAARAGRNLLYVACTRAEENLCLVTWRRPSPLLPHIHSKLVRGIDMSVEEL